MPFATFLKQGAFFMKSYAIYLALLLSSHATAQELPQADSTLKDPRYTSVKKGKLLLINTAASLAYIGLIYHCYKEEDNHLQKEMMEKRNGFNTQVNRMVSPLGLGE